jgi:hypothetical protein
MCFASESQITLALCDAKHAISYNVMFVCASLNEAGYLVYFRLEVRKSFNFKLSYA